jgi:hypothetical protein
VGDVPLDRLPDGLVVAPPQNMHAHNGLDLGALLVIDYLFHLPLEVAGVVLALCSFSLFKSWRSGRLDTAR